MKETTIMNPYRYTMADFAAQDRRQRRVQRRMLRGAWIVAALLIWSGITLLAWRALALPGYPPACPDGLAPTAWCGCEAPAYGTDC